MPISRWIAYSKFLSILPKFFLKITSLREAQAIIEQRLSCREENFLQVLKNAVFNYPQSPYRKLFEIAGYSYARTEGLLKTQGLEKTLTELNDAGVYFSVEEYKGAVAVKRKGTEFWVSPKDFDNPFIKHNPASSNDPRSPAGLITNFVLGRIEKIAVPQTLLLMQACKELYPDIYPLVWLSLFPPMSGIGVWISFIKANVSVFKWFSYYQPEAGGKLLGKTGAYLILLTAKFLGRRAAFPENINKDDAERVLRFIVKNKRKKLFVVAYPDSIMQLCHLAQGQNASLNNVLFYWLGEPMTARKRELIKILKADVVSTYAFREMGHVAFSCPLSSQETDEYHLCTDILALIERPRRIIPDLSINTLRWTALSLSLPKILINMENGDYGKIYNKTCNCPFGKSGFDWRISNIKSFEKLTSQEIGLFADELAELAENIFPKNIGGSERDYQFVQETSNNGRPRIYLYISPRKGEVDENLLNNIAHKYLEQVGHAQKLISLLWQDAPGIRIKRKAPIYVRRGRIPPFHIKNGVNYNSQKLIVQ